MLRLQTNVSLSVSCLNKDELGVWLMYILNFLKGKYLLIDHISATTGSPNLYKDFPQPLTGWLCGWFWRKA